MSHTMDYFDGLPCNWSSNKKVQQPAINQKSSRLMELKEAVKLIQWVKIARLFLHATSKLFQFTILKLSG